MSNNFVVCHFAKFNKSNLSSGAMGRHIDRECEPPNADKERTHLNFELAKATPGQNLRKSIESRINDGYRGKKAIRDNAVCSVGVILSGSNEQMKKIEQEGNIKLWALDSYKFIAEEFGEENIVRATVHMDEKTPHIHIHFVPLTADGRLSAKDLITKERLKSIQQKYAERMEKYGLERGISGSKRKHTTTRQFYKWINRNDLDAKKIIQGIIRSPEKGITLLSSMLQTVQELRQEKEPNIEKTKQLKENYHERRISKPNKRKGAEKGRSSSDFGIG